MIFSALGRRTAGVVGVVALLVAVGCGSDADSSGAGGTSTGPNGNAGGSGNSAAGAGHGTAGTGSGQSGASSGGSSNAQGGADDGSGNETGGAGGGDSSEGGAGGHGDDNSQGGAGDGGESGGEGGDSGGGEGGASGSNPDAWTQCVNQDDCVLTPMTCCGSCGAVTPEDAAAVNSQYLSEFREAACGGPGICPACAGEDDPRVSTYCGEDGHCVVDLALD